MAHEQMHRNVIISFPLLPAKIACGLHHTIAITNCLKSSYQDVAGAAPQEAAGVGGDAEGQPHEVEEVRIDVCVWGGNSHNVLGLAPSQQHKKVVGNSITFPERSRPVRLHASYAKYGEPYEIACGTNHTIFLIKAPDKASGVLFGSGLGNLGRLGQDNPTDDGDDEIEDIWCTFREGMIGPVRLGGKPSDPSFRVLRVVCGADHTLALSTDGKLYAFGVNHYGQCGTDVSNTINKGAALDEVMYPTLVRLPVGKRILHFAAGGQHSMAAVGDGEGEVFAWGNGRNGRLGHGTTVSMSTPHRLGALTNRPMWFVACGEAHSGAIDGEGRAFMWGAGSFGRLGVGSEADALVPKPVDGFDKIGEGSAVSVMIKSIALGGFHSLFLEELESVKGRLFSCGVGPACGLLAEGDKTIVSTPRHVQDPLFGSANPIRQIAAGMFHNFVLLQSGDLVFWGIGSNGRLGNDKAKSVASPNCMKPDIGRGYATIHPDEVDRSRRMYFTHKSEHEVYQQKSVVAETVASSVVSSRRAREKQDLARKANVQLACGALHSAAVVEGGQLYLWGCNDHGQLGLGDAETEQCVWKPRKLLLDSFQVKQIALGYEHTLVVTTQGPLWAWGKGVSGQLGTGHLLDQCSPVLVEGLFDVTTCAAGEEHSAAISCGGGRPQLWTWGSAENGMLGLGNDFMFGPQSSPMKVSLGSSELVPTTVRCGQIHTAVLAEVTSGGVLTPAALASLADKGVGAEKKLFTFGGGWFGRLGHNTQDNSYLPKEVNVSSAADVSCGAYHTCMLNKDGELFGWGRGRMLCALENLLHPKKFQHIEGEPRILSVTCGELHTIVLAESGQLWAWGDNKVGQLGFGFASSGPSEIPKQIKMPAPVLRVQTGPGHSLAIVGSGDVYGWGNQSCGRLGLAEPEQEKIVWEPSKVFSEWLSIHAMFMVGRECEEGPTRQDDWAEEWPTEAHLNKKEVSAKAAKELKEKQMRHILRSLDEGQKVMHIQTMQNLIKQESPKSELRALRALEQKLQERLGKVAISIRQLPEAEKQLSKTENDFHQSISRNSKFFKKSCVPEIDTTLWDPNITASLPFYGELLWVLQQQVAYLSRLSMCIKCEPETHQLLYRTIDRLYADWYDPRTRTLFLSLLRLMIDTEFENVSKIQDTFDRNTSMAFHTFSTYALSEAHYEDVVWKFMQTPTKTDSEQRLIMRLKATSDKSNIFALNFQEYQKAIKALGEKPKDVIDQQADFSYGFVAFKEFLMGSLLESINEISLPSDICTIFSHTVQAIAARTPDTGGFDAGTPPELAFYQPALQLFVHGILIPILTDTSKYAGREVFLSKSAEIFKNDPVIKSNIGVIVRFLEGVLDNSFDETDHAQRALVESGQLLKPELLKYIKAQCEDVQDLESQVVTHTYIAHFDRSPHVVQMPTSDLLSLSNLLNNNIDSLRISDNDAVSELVSKIPFWDPDLIVETSRNNHLHNFEMNTRFLITEEVPEAIVCPTSKVVMPRRLCATGGLGSARGSFNVFQADDNSDDPRRVLENLFKVLDPLNATNFEEMRKEVEELKERYKTEASQVNYEMMQQLEKGTATIGELLNVQAHPEDVIEFMSQNLIDRDRHSKYLHQIEIGVGTIENAMVTYKENLTKWKRELQQALERSRDLSLPQKLVTAAGVVDLSFAKVQKLAKRGKKFDSKQIEELELSFTPMQTFALKTLEKKNVVVEIMSTFDDPSIKKNTKITVKATVEGGVDMIVILCQGQHQNIVKTLQVDEEQLQQMKAAKKDMRVPIAAPGEERFLTVLASEFVKLIADMLRKTPC